MTENRCPICGDQTRVETDECRDCALNRIREIPDDEFERACKDLLGGCGSGRLPSMATPETTIRSYDDEQLERDLEAVRERFSYQQPKPEDKPLYTNVGESFRMVAEAIVRNVPAGRERATALTCLSEARMHANAGIALAGTKGA